MIQYKPVSAISSFKYNIINNVFVSFYSFSDRYERFLYILTKLTFSLCKCLTKMYVSW